MSAQGRVLLPVLLRFPGPLAREEGWGRLLHLAASAASLCTQTTLRVGENVLLSFEVHGERFDGLSASVEHSAADEDGFCRAELRFTDEVEKRRLARVLADVLSRSL
jgi:hypothetical protein